MKKRLFAWLAAAALLLSLGSISAFAADDVATAVPKLWANAGSVHVDGVLQGTLSDGEFDDIAIVPDTALGEDIYCGASWGTDPDGSDSWFVFLEVYAVKKNLTKVSVELGGVALELNEGAANAGLPEGVKYAFGNTSYTQKAQTEDEADTTITCVNILELAIPMTSVSFSEADGEVTAALNLSAETDAGVGSFRGMVGFTANEVFISHSMLGYNTNDGTTKMTWGGKTGSGVKQDYTNGRHFTQDYAADNTVGSGAMGAYNTVISMMEKIEVLAEVDLTVTALPVGAPATNEVAWDKTANPSRVVFQIGRGVTSGDRASQVMLLVLYNKSAEEGLMLVRDVAVAQPSAENVMLLGKKEGDSFTLGMRWNLDNSVAVYVDGELTGVFPAMSSDVLDARNGWEGSGYGMYIKARGGTTMMAETEDTLDITAVNVSLAYAHDFDADEFLAKAAGSGTADGPDTPDNPTTPDNPDDDPEENTANPSASNQGSTEPGTEPLAADTEPEPTAGNAGKEEGGCASAVSGLAIVGISVIAASMLTRKRKKD